MVSAKVDLAHEEDFVLGRLTVRPAHRELVRDDGEREVLEHRVMQILIALARAQGAVVARDDLIRDCWDGRIVGDDAINRAISKLRKVADGIGAGSFNIETATKVGYSLLLHDGAAIGAAIAAREASGASSGPRASRRTLAVGLLATGALGALGGGTLLYRGRSRPSVPPEVSILMTQGALALEQTSPDAHNEGIGAYRRVVRIAPDYADGWGMLGFAYAFLCHFRERALGETMRARAMAAGRRALELDPANAYGEVALAAALPFKGHWKEREDRLRLALEREPNNYYALRMLGGAMIFAGRPSEAVRLFGRIGRRPLTASVYSNYIEALWDAGLLEETDRAIEDAILLYPTHPMVWGMRLIVLQHSGRTGAAAAVLQDPQSWPQGFDERAAEEALAVTRAIGGRAPSDVSAVMDALLWRVREGTGAVGEAIRVACALGRVDEAFAVADAFYLGRGFTVPDRVAPASFFHLQPSERFTRFLFEPATAPMRADPRFGGLVEELGLERYWREAGVQPDYRRA